MTLYEIIRSAILGYGETGVDVPDATTRVLMVMPQIVTDDMVERAAEAWWEHFDGPGFNVENILNDGRWVHVKKGARLALTAALKDMPDEG